MRYVSYIRAMPNNPFRDFSLCQNVADGMEALVLQKIHIRTYANNRSIQITKEYKDSIKNGVCTDTAFQTLLSDGIGRKFDCVIVDSIDWCGTSLWKAKEILLETFQCAGIYFIVVQDDFDSSLGHGAAQEYFRKKYLDWKRNHMRTESFAKNWIPQNPLRQEHSAEVYASNPLKGILYDPKKNKPLKMKAIGGKQYFLRTPHIPKDLAHRSLSKDEMEKLILDAMDAEKKMAERVLQKLKDGEGKNILQYRLSLIGARMRQEFVPLAAAEFSEVEFTRHYENGGISEDEYHRRRGAQQNILLEADKIFQEAETVGAKLENAFGFANPWITLMQSWEHPDKLTRPTVKKFLKKVYVQDFKDITIITKMDEWKKLLPEEWLLC